MTRLCEVAGQLGVEPGRLTGWLDVARQRDAACSRALLAAAAASPFALQAYEPLSERAARLGLRSELAASKHLLEKRRRGLAAQMQALGAAPGTSVAAAAAAAGAPAAVPFTAAAVEQLCATARALGGLGKEAASLEARLQQQQLALQVRAHATQRALRQALHKVAPACFPHACIAPDVVGGGPAPRVGLRGRVTLCCPQTRTHEHTRTLSCTWCTALAVLGWRDGLRHSSLTHTALRMACAPFVYMPHVRAFPGGAGWRLQERLELAAEQDSVRRYSRLLRHAAALGMAPAMLAPAANGLARRQQVVAQRLAAAAAGGALQEFLEARGSAVRAGLAVPELLAADRQLGARRREAAAQLPAALGRLLATCSSGQASCRALVGPVQALGPALGLCPAAGRLLPAEGCGGPSKAGQGAGAATASPQPAAATLPSSGTGSLLPASQQQLGGKGAGVAGPPSPAPAAARHVRPSAPEGRLPRDTPPPEVMSCLDTALREGLQPANGSDAAGLRHAFAAVWGRCVASLQLGLGDGVLLGLVALHLHCSVGVAQGKDHA